MPRLARPAAGLVATLVTALVTTVFATGCFGLLGGTLKEMANTHVITTGLPPAEYGAIDRGATHHGCTKVDRGAKADNYQCPELPAANPIGCRVEGEAVRCACTGDEGTCERLIAAIVAEGRAP
ncbi:MAG: hypothetical protein JNK64_29060 [Myxococcales bacterium]|nr:hypothetical protein [Myxococcales bacterium]